MMYSNQQKSVSVAKSIAAYTLLPGFFSRAAGFAPRFGLIAYLMAVIFESVRLLPKNHPFTEGAKIEQYRIRDVLALAANNLNGGFKNSDQYIVFGMFFTGLVLLGLQFIFLFAMIATRTADAAIPFVGMFVTINPQTDIAHLMLDRVFGIPAFFNSCFDPAINGAFAVCSTYYTASAFPDSFQSAMQALFRFYTFGMLGVAGFVVLYYIIAMFIETTNTGVPFGKRYQSIYTPIRLVIAVLLLLPLAYGYNTGQYIVLLSAKWGSALATNSWLIFNDHAGDNPMGMTSRELIGKPTVGEISSVLNFMYVAQACRAAYSLGMPDPNSTASPPDGVKIEPFFVRGGSATQVSSSTQLANGTTFDAAKTFYGQGDVKIVFGEKHADHKDYPGSVKPYCGIMLMPALSKDIPGIKDLYNVYFKNVLDMWFNPDLTAYGKRMACVIKFSGLQTCQTPAALTVGWGAPANTVAGQEFYVSTRLTTQANFTSQMNAQIVTMRSTTNPAISMDVKTLLTGWGGAGLWFNKVMAFNGAMVDALDSLPTPVNYPLIMEHVAKVKRTLAPKTPQTEIFEMQLPSDGKTVSLDKFMEGGPLSGTQSQNVEISMVLSKTFAQVQEGLSTSRPKVGKTESPIKNFIGLLFGQSGLFDFRANSEVFPLAKLAMLGRELLDKTIIMIASRTVMSGMGGMVGAELGPMGEAIKSIGPAMGTFATVGVSIGILLYYVVPLMPFIYFFFGVGRWVKSIFEAMIAVPLWALAHLRLGGEGLPGPAAGQGYFLILEIFLRPILTLFGLMASIGSFMALTYGLDSVFNLAVLNVGGFDMTTLAGGSADSYAQSARDGMDALFYTVIYAMLVYMIATSSFKLIDLLPNAVMRWGGTNTASFKDQTDPINDMRIHMTLKADNMARKIDNQNNQVGNIGKSFAQKQLDRDLQNGPK